MNSSKKKIAIIDILVLVVLAVVLGVSMVWSRDIELKLGLLYYVDADSVSADEVVQPKNSGVYASADGAGLYIYYLDVGQGDCTIIEFPDGKTMIIDAGENKKSVESAIDGFITKTFGTEFRYFDYAILTHPDSDHCGSMDFVLDKYPARVSYRPNVQATNKDYVDPAGDLPKDKDTAAYRDSIEAMYTEIDGEPAVVYVTDPADEKQTIIGADNSYTFTFYSPLSEKYTDWNDYSPIMILSYHGFNFALSGDAEKANEAEFVAKVQAAPTDGVKDKYDIFTDSYTVNAIKCGHHGSRTSTSLGYINAITTESGAKQAYYIISCGEGNSYGHPHSETMEKLQGLGVPEDNILRTDILGDITLSVRLDENGVYNLYCGDKATDAPVTPDPDPDPVDTDTEKKEQVLVYRKVGSIKLTWGVVAWTVYAVLVIAAVVHIVLYGNDASDSDSGKSGTGSGKKSNSTKSKNNSKSKSKMSSGQRK